MEVRDGVAVLTLNRPAKLNALNLQMLTDLRRFFGQVRENDAIIGAVLTGTGTAFSAGQDLDVTPQSREEMDQAIEHYNDITRAVLSCPKPVIAAINGIAVGGGLEITLPCDQRIASDNAEVFLPENLRGLAISNGASYLLPRLVGSYAMALVMDSRRIDAREARRIGLFDDVVAPADLLGTALGTIQRWGADGTATPMHLNLMRPPVEDVERAMERERQAAGKLADRGKVRRGAYEYLGGSR
ncbi:enoyl-CoA hydratase/isomerase family protein (plasmid) [Nocardioides sp. R1-1]|uniref:enoyl-CoA hydratase/isomerase family protein n=1 Tax=Nocardioides sp. R1-1 TaxID=3383502 RepID=UPI0038D1F032